eukprot:2628227-Pleurochrysis_carterae.AAC.5
MSVRTSSEGGQARPELASSVRTYVAGDKLRAANGGPNNHDPFAPAFGVESGTRNIEGEGTEIRSRRAKEGLARNGYHSRLQRVWAEVR